MFKGEWHDVIQNPHSGASVMRLAVVILIVVRRIGVPCTAIGRDLHEV